MASGYTCECAMGWTGTHCDVNINDCKPGSCLNGGVCYVSYVTNIAPWRCSYLSITIAVAISVTMFVSNNVEFSFCLIGPDCQLQLHMSARVDWLQLSDRHQWVCCLKPLFEWRNLHCEQTRQPLHAGPDLYTITDTVMHNRLPNYLSVTI